MKSYCVIRNLIWNSEEQIQTISGHINDSQNIYPVFLWNVLQNTNAQQQSKIMFSTIMCSKFNMGTAVAFNIRRHTLILNWMHDMNMRLPKVIHNIFYWFEVASLILEWILVLCLIVWMLQWCSWWMCVSAERWLVARANKQQRKSKSNVFMLSCYKEWALKLIFSYTFGDSSMLQCRDICFSKFKAIQQASMVHANIHCAHHSISCGTYKHSLCTP